MYFLFVPYVTLEKTGIEMPFLPILDTFLAIPRKVPILATFPTFPSKSAQFCQIDLAKMSENHPFWDPEKPTKTP